MNPMKQKMSGERMKENYPKKEMYLCHKKRVAMRTRYKKKEKMIHQQKKEENEL